LRRRRTGSAVKVRKRMSLNVCGRWLGIEHRRHPLSNSRLQWLRCNLWSCENSFVSELYINVQSGGGHDQSNILDVAR
jgi:hypothetical protein